MHCISCGHSDLWPPLKDWCWSELTLKLLLNPHFCPFWKTKKLQKIQFFSINCLRLLTAHTKAAGTFFQASLLTVLIKKLGPHFLSVLSFDQKLSCFWCCTAVRKQPKTLSRSKAWYYKRKTSVHCLPLKSAEHSRQWLYLAAFLGQVQCIAKVCSRAKYEISGVGVSLKGGLHKSRAHQWLHLTVIGGGKW